MRAIRLLFAPLALGTLLAVGCGREAPSVPESAIAVVGDATILRAQFDSVMAQAERSYAASGRRFPASGTAAHIELQQLAVRVLVEQAELEQEGPKLGVHVDAAHVEARLRDLKESLGGETGYRRRLSAVGMTDGQIRAAIRAQLVSAGVRAAVTAEVTVGHAAVKRYYEANLRTYSSPQARAIRHILVRSHASAMRVFSAAQAGGSFAALARRHSRDPRTRDRGGALTLIAGSTAPELDRVAFALPTGRLSRPFRTRFGWELVQALKPVQPRRVRPLAAVSASIRTTLLTERRNRAFATWLARVEDDFAQRTAYADGFAPGSP